MASVEEVVDSLLQGQLDKAMDDIHQILTQTGEVNGIKELGVLLQEATRQEQLHTAHVKDVIKAYMSMKENMESVIAQDTSADSKNAEIKIPLAQLQKQLQSYMAMKENMESVMAQDTSADSIGAEISQLQAQHQKALENTETAKQQCQALKEERDKMHSQQEELSQKRETVKEDTTQVLPKTRYNVSLYSCITRIKWDYDCKPDEIKGYVSTSKDVRPFSLDRKQHSKFFTTNYLWDLVEAAI